MLSIHITGTVGQVDFPYIIQASRELENRLLSECDH